MSDTTSCESRKMLSHCPVCSSRRLRYAFSHQKYRLSRCGDCQLMLLNPQPSTEELAAISHRDEGDRDGASAQVFAHQFLRAIERYSGIKRGRLLQVGSADGALLEEAGKLGFEVASIALADAMSPKMAAEGIAEAQNFAPESYDFCILSEAIEYARDPRALLDAVHAMLKPGGVLFIRTPALDAWPARLFKENWEKFKPEHLTYFDSKTIQSALFRAGFHETIVGPVWETLNFEGAARQLERHPAAFLSPLLRAVSSVLPASVRRHNFKVAGGEMMVLSRKTTLAARRKLSVVVPAYNEAATFVPLIEALLAKKVPGIELEVVIVESASSDGTREMALAYKSHPRVKLVLEDSARGKGHAVRAGLAQSTGDFVLIQDADLEYDLEDYEALLEPLMSGQEAFVLGSRHSGNVWKMRSFTNQRLLSACLNFGHWFFTTLVNYIYWQRLKDPFTMFKVFRRDCLFGLTFECNRFDFDYELLIKLIRKGYKPLELPVNYRSRSFAEGKKVSMVADPISWLRALARLRFARIDPLAAIERRRAEACEPANEVLGLKASLCT